MKRMWWAGILLCALVLASCASGGAGKAPIEVSDAWVRAAGGMQMEGHGAMATPATEDMAGMGMVSAAYMRLRNNGSAADRLLRAESDVAQAVELHISEMQGGVMTMRPIEYIEVPANGEAELKPGGMHVMLIGLKRELKAGETVSLVLVFEKAGRINVQAEVRAP